MKNLDDHIVRAVAAGGNIRAYCATTGSLTEHARQIHNTSPVVTAALGRLLTAGAIMGSMQKGENDLLTLQITGSGPLKGLTVTAGSKADVKGYPVVPDVILPANSKGKLDVSTAIGEGILTVTRDIGLKDPYVGQVELISGEIAEDLAYYYSSSEQLPSAVALGVLMKKNNTVKRSGGLIIQALPGASDECLAVLEDKLSKIPSMTDMLDQGMTPSDILEEILGSAGLQILDTIPTEFKCNCSRKRVEKVLASLGRTELQKMAAEGEPVEVRCSFCNKAYVFKPDELEHYWNKKDI